MVGLCVGYITTHFLGQLHLIFWHSSVAVLSEKKVHQNPVAHG